jgi:methylsterol monooxygenase
MAFVGNYSSTFRHWDWIFGTDKGYNSWKAKLGQKKLSTKTRGVKEE